MKILYTVEQVQQRINEMAHDLIQRYPDDKPLFVCLLKGAVPFTSQLMMAITRQSPTFYPEVVYLHISAYGDERQATNAATYSSIDQAIVKGREVIVLDDCLDRGLTYQETKRQLTQQGAKHVALVVLANKQVNRSNDDAPLLAGFETPDVWLTGMGMDDAATAPEAERWAGYIGDVSS